MPVIKCKMCGGDIDFVIGSTYGTCEYCGSTSTIPQADDEGKLNRYNRANHFRRQCEFDKAVAAYEKLLEQDDTDAEAHWGAVISRYGIEYVEDPATKKRIPTCHRVQVASILTDADYLAAVENAPDGASRDLYTEQANEIAEIQKNILAVSANEPPYDVFICYKETDEFGARTRDSALAQDIYYGLTNEDYHVFFSKITLEDKLGQQYEPYIFAALNSAKVMVVVGTRPEYFEAVWVKNEWSRYLALMKTDRKRLLIPCYRDMDPYDLPDELSSLQSQDMGKIGFMQDLIRGIKKVLDSEKEKAAPQTIVQKTVVGVGNSDTAPLLKRAMMFLEDSDFGSAVEYADRILDIDPELAPAYLVKVLAKQHCHNEKELEEKRGDANIANDPDFMKVVRFSDDKDHYNKLAKLVADSAAFVEIIKKLRISIEIQDGVNIIAPYARSELKDRADENRLYHGNEIAISQEEYQQAAEKLQQLGDYPYASECSELCKKLSEMVAAVVSERKHEKKLQLMAESLQRENLYKSAKYRNEKQAIESAVTVAKNKVDECRKRLYTESDSKKNAWDRYEQKKAEVDKAAIAAANASIFKKKQLTNECDSLRTELNHMKSQLDIVEEEARTAQTELEKTEEECEKTEQDADDKLESIRQKMDDCVTDIDALKQTAATMEPQAVEALSKPGNIVKFGRYPQDSDDGKQPIEWIVIHPNSKGRYSFLLSRYVLDGRQYHHCVPYPTWEKSDIRKWLNDDFYNVAFTTEEQTYLLEVNVRTPDNSETVVMAFTEKMAKDCGLSIEETKKKYPVLSYEPTLGGNDCKDHVYLLTAGELVGYLGMGKSLEDAVGMSNKKIGQTPPTAYAQKRGVRVDEKHTKGGKCCCRWWLRSPGFKRDHADICEAAGYYLSRQVLFVEGVRPVIVVRWDDTPVTIEY